MSFGEIVLYVAALVTVLLGFIVAAERGDAVLMWIFAAAVPVICVGGWIDERSRR